MTIRLLKRTKKNDQAANCHTAMQVDSTGLPLVVLVGSPNVGKSVLFNALTGAYVTVSNYPGTTVELSRGRGRADGIEFGVVDTPGMYRLLPITEEERVARAILLRDTPALVIHVVDAKNLERMLPMTLQLIEAGLNVLLDINLMDEAERYGVEIDVNVLQARLGIPVVATALAQGRGVSELKDQIALALRPHCGCATESPQASIRYPAAVENGISVLEEHLGGKYPVSRRTIAALLLQGDEQVGALIKETEQDRAAEILDLADKTAAHFGQPTSYILARSQRESAQRVLEKGIGLAGPGKTGWAERLSEATMRPLTGLPILFVSLFILYEFVGVLGAQVLVGFLENTVFGAWLNPGLTALLELLIPWAVLRDLIGGPYGIITLGVRYAVAIILPIVGTFFIAFSIIEDSGYLPRLAMLIDKVFKRIGLNGRAVIPLVLGFGCDTMATVVTRTLETRRERVLATLLLSLAIPCSAQLGVMFALLNGRPDLLLIWTSIVALVLLLIGYLAARLMPGERPAFYMELPPLRLPTLRNIFVKTYTRMEWYFREVLPLFVVASVLIWLGRITGVFDLLVSMLALPVHLLGLPDRAAVAFLFGFFRRDYGAAGLYDMKSAMTGVQLIVAAVTMTIFVPCIAQFSITVKERGWKTAVAIAAFIFPFAFGVGWALNQVLTVFGVRL